MNEQKLKINKETMKNFSLKQMLEETEKALNRENYAPGFEFESDPIVYDTDEMNTRDFVAIRYYNRSYSEIEPEEQQRVEYILNEYNSEDDY